MFKQSYCYLFKTNKLEDVKYVNIYKKNIQNTKVHDHVGKLVGLKQIYLQSLKTLNKKEHKIIHYMYKVKHHIHIMRFITGKNVTCINLFIEKKTI